MVFLSGFIEPSSIWMFFAAEELEPPLILRTRKLKVKRERNRERKKDRKKVQRGVQAPSGGAVDSQWQEAGAGGSGARGERLHADAVEESVPGATEAGRA